MFKRGCVVIAAALLAGCGGGGGSGSPAVVSVPSVPVAPTATPTPGSTQLQSATLTIVIPRPASPTSSVRAPFYVSPSTTKVNIVVNSVNGGAVPAYVTVNSTYTLTGCVLSAGTETCTVPVEAPIGSVNYTFIAEDTTGNALSEVTKTFTIVQGSANTALTATLQGVVSTVTAMAGALTANTAISAGETVTVNAFDADGNLIVNGSTAANYANPITLVTSDATGATLLSVNGAAGLQTVTVNAPTDTVKLIYTGQAINYPNLQWSGSNITTGSFILGDSVNDITFTGTTDDTAANGGLTTDLNYGAQTVFFSQASGTAAITAAELGYTNAPYNKQFSVTLTGCTGIATVTPGPATIFTITASGAGICKGRVQETGTGYPLTNHTANPMNGADANGETHDGTFYISVTSSSFGVNAVHRGAH